MNSKKCFNKISVIIKALVARKLFWSNYKMKYLLLLYFMTCYIFYELLFVNVHIFHMFEYSTCNNLVSFLKNISILSVGISMSLIPS